MWPNPQETADLVTFTEEILNGKFYFLCCVKLNISRANLNDLFTGLSNVKVPFYKKKTFCLKFVKKFKYILNETYLIETENAYTSPYWFYSSIWL